jgi:hypothetical protein
MRVTTTLGALRVHDQHSRLMTLGAMRAFVTDACLMTKVRQTKDQGQLHPKSIKTCKTT